MCNHETNPEQDFPFSLVTPHLSWFEREIVASDEAATIQAEEFPDYCSKRAWLFTQVKVSEHPADAKEQLTLACRSDIEDATADTALRLGSGLATVLAPVYRPAAAIVDADYIQRMLLANGEELRRFADTAPDIIAEMRRRRLIPVLADIE